MRQGGSVLGKARWLDGYRARAISITYFIIALPKTAYLCMHINTHTRIHAHIHRDIQMANDPYCLLYYIIYTFGLAASFSMA